MAAASLSAFPEDIPLELDLSTAHQIEARALPGGGDEIRTLGEDPFVASRPLTQPYDPEKQYVLSFEYLCLEGLDSFQLFYGVPFAQERSATGPEVPASEGWTRYSLDIKARQEPESWRGGYREFRLDFGRKPGRTIQLRNIQLREPTADELALARTADTRRQTLSEFDAKLRAMTEARYAAGLLRVEAFDRVLRITAAVPAQSDPLCLCEVPFYQSPVGGQDFVWQQTLPARAGTLTIEVERMRDGHDRVFSSWILMRKTAGGLEPASHPRFVDTLPSRWTLARDRAASKKGTAGINGRDAFQIQDYKKLGIRHATKNIVLSSLVSPTAGKDTIPHEFNGITIYIHPKRLEELDQSMTAMDQLKMVVSAIILIQRGHSMAHPDCTPEGIYAMANVVEPTGWNVYAAGLDFLAQRYLRPDRKYGRITHWILHNEVDAGWIWTNAGEKPLATYLDLYYRSMRTAQSVIRRYGDAGQVLVSLTHYWTARHNSRCYPPKAMLDLLAKRSAQEGDFDWGLAYHPYPQDLRNPRTWEDKNVTFDFETPLITPKNLEVLDAYMRQPAMRTGGAVRTIVLSEQGLNSPDHTEQSYRNQAAGLVYTWLKVEKLDSIESFVHHQWRDHPREGGLNLGLRRLPETSTEAARNATAAVCREFETFGLKPSPDETSKPAWDVYRVLETPAQAKAVLWAQSVVASEQLRLRNNVAATTNPRTP